MKKDIPNLIYFILFIFIYFIHQQYSNYNIIFTDGSKKSACEYVGCAFLDSASNTVCTYKLPKEASVYTAEAIAILKVLEYNNIKNINYSNRYLIRSDSF